MLFGIQQLDSDICTEIRATGSDGAALRGRWQREWLRVETATTIGHFDDATAAITSQPIGAGNAILIATYPSLLYHDTRCPETASAIRNLLPRKTLGQTWSEPGAGLISRQGTGPNGTRTAIMINWTSRPAKARLRNGHTITVNGRSGCAWDL